MDDKKKQLKTGFLDPLIRRNNLRQNQRKKMKVMAAYIGRAMYNHVQHGKDLIIAPHHFK
jgi:hypothetical protein